MNYHYLLITPGFPKDENETNTVTYLINFILQFKKQPPQVKFTVLSLHYPFEAMQFVWHGIEIRSFGCYHLPKLMKPTIWYKCFRSARSNISVANFLRREFFSESIKYSINFCI